MVLGDFIVNAFYRIIYTSSNDPFYFIIIHVILKKTTGNILALKYHRYSPTKHQFVIDVFVYNNVYLYSD